MNVVSEYHLCAGPCCGCVSTVNAIHVLMSKSLLIALQFQLQIHALEPIAPLLFRKSGAIGWRRWSHLDQRQTFRHNLPVSGFGSGRRRQPRPQDVCNDFVHRAPIPVRSLLDLAGQRIGQIEGRVHVAILPFVVGQCPSDAQTSASELYHCERGHSSDGRREMGADGAKKAAGRLCELRRSPEGGACEIFLLRKTTGRGRLHCWQFSGNSAAIQVHSRKLELASRGSQ